MNLDRTRLASTAQASWKGTMTGGRYPGDHRLQRPSLIYGAVHVLRSRRSTHRRPGEQPRRPPTIQHTVGPRRCDPPDLSTGDSRSTRDYFARPDAWKVITMIVSVVDFTSLDVARERTRELLVRLSAQIGHLILSLAAESL